MTAFEVSLNGKRFCTAGLTDGVLSTVITWADLAQKGSRKSKTARKGEFLSLRVGGLDTTTNEHLHWKTRILKEGDVVMVRVADIARVNKPSERTARDPKKDLRAKQRYVRNAAKELGWTLIEKAASKKKPAKKRAA